MTNSIEDANVVMIDNKDGTQTPMFKDFLPAVKGLHQKYYIPDCQYRRVGKTIHLKIKFKKPKIIITGLPYQEQSK